ncbi:transforming growth factor-beta receptor-associated protein 1-like isoform X2 [Periplaneta americana]
MHDLDIIGGGPKLRGISTFGVNENPNINNPFCIQICVGRKKQLQVYNVTEEKLIHVKDIAVPEPTVCIAVDGAHICAALLTQYAVYNFDTNFTQQLFTYGCENFLPAICRITKEEFLVNAPEGLGMFVNAEGMSNRPPIQWSYPLRALAYSHPYILGLSDEVIMVYSILDQQQKQALSFTGGRSIGNFEGHIYVTSGTSVVSLAPVPWEKQVEVLLADSRVEEALELAQNANHFGMTKEQYQKKKKKIQQQAAFIYFSNGDFDKAHELFVSGEVDLREVISLFPNLLPSSSTFVRSIPPLHCIADVNQLFHGDEGKLREAKQFLRNFLEDVRETTSVHHTLEADTALLKLYAEISAPELEGFIAAGEITCDVRDCCEWLDRCKCYHALALLHRQARDHEKALKVWAKIISGEYKDDTFHGLDFFVECLANLKEPELLWRYADFVLSRDEEIGVGIFTLRSAHELSSDTMKPDSIVEYLHQYPKAVVKYLEHLVIKQDIQKEKFHTHLAVLYLDDILKKRKEGKEEEAMDIRMKLRHLLQISNLYRVQLLLGKMNDANLHQEAAILYGKIEEHEKALDILVHNLKDFKGAELYCVNNTQGKGLKYKHHLFETLLAVYLDPKLESEQKEEYLLPALELLNARAGDFDATKILEMIPPNWSISVVEAFLRGALRTSLHKYRMTKVESALARGENLQNRFALYDLQRHSISLHENNYCCVCKKPFSDGNFARYPNNVITHVACARHNNICPLTGKNFKSLTSLYTAR